MNRNFYENARKRCMSKPPLGTHIITDADIILMQEEEIESYRKEIASYEAAIANSKIEILAIKDGLSRIADEREQLTKENRKLREENAKLSEAKTFKVGDLIRFGERGYKIRKVNVNLNAGEATFIGEEVELYF